MKWVIATLLAFAAWSNGPFRLPELSGEVQCSLRLAGGFRLVVGIAKSETRGWHTTLLRIDRGTAVGPPAPITFRNSDLRIIIDGFHLRCKSNAGKADLMLELRNVSKHFSSIPAVDDVSFSARPGEVTGYLGPNGSGKSTTMKMITGLIEMTMGHILFEGKPIEDDLIAYKRRMGYVPEEPYLYNHLSGLEYLTMVAQLRELPARQSAERIDGMLRLLSLHDDRHASISGYSKGMRQKVLIIAALMHNPELILLDEPFSGLDVASSLVLRSLDSGAGRARQSRAVQLARTGYGRTPLLPCSDSASRQTRCRRLHRAPALPDGAAYAGSNLFAACGRAGHRFDGAADSGPYPCISSSITRSPACRSTFAFSIASFSCASSTSKPCRFKLMWSGFHRPVCRRAHHDEPDLRARRVLFNDCSANHA